MTLRRCRICEQPIEHKPMRATTCGHPRCVRANRGGAPGTRALLRDWTPPDIMAPDRRGQERVRSVMERHITYGMDATSAIVATAHELGLSVAQVWSTWKVVGA